MRPRYSRPQMCLIKLVPPHDNTRKEASDRRFTSARCLCGAARCCGTVHRLVSSLWQTRRVIHKGGKNKAGLTLGTQLLRES